MPDPAPHLDPAVLEELAARTPPSPQARDRVRAKLEATIPAMRPRVSGSRGGAGAAGPLGSLFPIATFVLGGLAGGALIGALRNAPPAQIVYIDRPAARASASTGEGDSNRSPAVPASALPVPASKAPSGSSQRPPLEPSSQLAAEQRLLDSARAALASGEPERALARVAAHNARFPQGLLAEEREALAVQALVRAGRHDEARARAAAFRERAPNSLFRAAVDSAIDSIR